MHQKNTNNKDHQTEFNDAPSFSISKNKLLIKSEDFPDNSQTRNLMNPLGGVIEGAYKENNSQNNHNSSVQHQQN